MRLATIRIDGHPTASRIEDDTAVVIDGYRDVGALLQDPRWREIAATAEGTRLSVADVSFGPVVIAPEKIICVGLNYRDHCAEVGVDPPEFPTLFAKFHRSLLGASDPLVLSPASSAVDWEAELGVIVGAEIRNGTLADDAIAGYTIVNDVSMRDWQRRTSQFLQGKTFEASTPVGPWLVTADELEPDGLAITCDVAGMRMQSSNTRELVFDVPSILEYVSTVVTLAPGDLIATGTPGGVGALQRPPRFLRDGDTVEVRIEGIGTLTTHCVASPEWASAGASTAS